MSIYNCKADEHSYRVTKFTADLEVESSYLVSAEACDCPAGHRHTCRHRQMLPLFEAKSATRGQYFLDFDRKVWLPAIADEDYQESTVLMPLPTIAHSITLPEDASSEDVAHAFSMLGLVGADARPPAPHIPNNPTPGPELGNRPKSDLRRI